MRTHVPRCVPPIGFPAADVASPDTLVLVHVVSIGWLSMAMCGALFQFVPVLVAKPLFTEKWALPALGLLTAGLTSLVAGFLALGGRLPNWLWLLPVGAFLLIAGFGPIVVDLGLTAWLRPTGPARFVEMGPKELDAGRPATAALRAAAWLSSSFIATSCPRVASERAGYTRSNRFGYSDASLGGGAPCRCHLASQCRQSRRSGLPRGKLNYKVISITYEFVVLF
jgi:hypothetical protein